MAKIGNQHYLTTYIKRSRIMIKRLLNKLFRLFTFDYDREKIEKYLSQSSNTYDLEQRIRELDQNNNYNRFYL
jgi:hypothetical protein